jgi:branched-chain amino acid transport system ATP-binding protein
MQNPIGLQTVAMTAHPDLDGAANAASATETPGLARTASESRSEPVVLTGTGLRKSFGGEVVLDGVDVRLTAGQVVLLRGENGSGKTTLLNILTGNLEPDSGSISYLADGTPRSFRFPRRWWQELNPLDHFRPEFVAREGVGRTWQDIRLFGSRSLRDNIAAAVPGAPGENPAVALFAPWISSRRETASVAEADRVLASLGLAGREDSFADLVSLGQSKRVAIARAVAAGAKVLFLDEPLAGLDRSGIAGVLELLRALVARRQLTLVIVEHVFNQSHLRNLVTTDWLLQGGRIVESHISRPDTLAMRHSPDVPEAGSHERPEWFAALAGPGASIVDEPLPRNAILTRIRRTGWTATTSKPVLEIRDLVVNRGPRTVIGLDASDDPVGLSLTLHEGETAILQAPNGWGKSTLFAAIAGLIPISGGQIRLRGADVGRTHPWQRFAAGLRALPACSYTFPSLTGAESLRLAGHADVPRSFAPFATRLTGSLSGGEQRRLSLWALAPSDLNVLDEPFSGLDSPHLVIEQLGSHIPSSRTVFILAPLVTY